MRSRNPVLCQKQFLLDGFRISTIHEPDLIYKIEHLNRVGARIVIRMYSEYIDITDFYCLSWTSRDTLKPTTMFFSPSNPNLEDQSLEDSMLNKAIREDVIFTSDRYDSFIEIDEIACPSVHPGKHVLSRINAMNLTITQFSERAGLPEKDIKAVVEGREIPSNSFLETAFPTNGSPEYFIQLRNDYCRSVGIKPPQP